MSGNHRTVESNLTSSLEDTQHDPRYLLMFLSPLSIRKSLYEGGNPGEALEYLEYLLNAKFDDLEPDLDFSPPIKSKALKIIQKMNEAYRLIVRYPHTSLTPLKNFISQSLKEDNYCYIPLFWLGDNAHAYVLKFRTSKQGTLVSAINLGSGVQYHPLIVEKDQQAYFDYRSAEMRFDFDQQLSVSFLESMVAIANDPLDEMNVLVHESYSEEDLYSQLFALDSIEQDSINFSRAARAQATGTCSVTSIEKALFDGLLEASVFERDIQNFVLTLKEHALLNALATSQQPNDAKYGLWALQSLRNEFNELCFEKTFSVSESEKKLALYQQLEQALTLKATESQPNIELKLPAGLTLELKQTPHKDTEKAQKIVQERQQDLAIKRFDFTRPRKEELMDTLDAFIKKVEKTYSNPENAELIEQAFEVFYHFEGEQDYWNYFSDEKGELLIQRLSTLIGIYNRDVQFSPFDKRVDKMVTTLTAFNIAAKVASNVSSLSLNGSYALGIQEDVSNMVIKDAQKYQQLKRLLLDFSERMADKKIVFSNTMLATPLWLKETTNEKEKEKAARLKEFYDCFNEFNSIDLYESLLGGECYSRSRRARVSFNPTNFLSSTKTSLMELSQAFHYSLHDHQPPPAAYNGISGSLGYYQNRFMRESAISRTLESDSLLESSRYQNALRRLPPIESVEHSDFSENLIFYPQYDLKQFKLGDELYDLTKTGWLYKLDGNTLSSAEQAEDFKAISTNPLLQVSEALLWATSNLAILKEKNIQQTLESHVFRFGLIEYSLASGDKATLKLIGQFLEKCLRHYYPVAKQQEEHNSTFLWLYSLQKNLKEYLNLLAKDYQLVVNGTPWPDFDRVLESVEYWQIKSPLQGEFAKAVLGKLSCQDYFSDQEYQALIGALISTQMNGFSINDLPHHNSLLQRLQQGVKALSNEQLSSLINHSLRQHYPLPKETSWLKKGDVLVDESQTIEIDLNSGKLYHLNFQPQKFTFAVSQLEKLASIDSNLLTKDYLLIATNPHQVISTDGQWHFFLENGYSLSYAKKTFCINGVNVELYHNIYPYQTLSELGLLKELIHLSPGSQTPKTRIWGELPDETLYVQEQLLVENLETAQAYWLVEKGLFQHLNLQNGLWQSTQEYSALSQQWQKLPRQWKSFCANSFHELSTTLLLQEHLPNQFTVTGFYHPELLSSWTIKGERIYSTKFIGYELLPYKKKADFKLKIPHFYLKKDDDTLIIIPYLERQTIGKLLPFEKRSHSGIKGIVKIKEPFFMVREESSGSLVPLAQRHHLYLSLLYRSIGQYQQATVHLEQSRSAFTNTLHENALFNQMKNQHDYSDPGVLYDLKFILRYHQQSKKWSNEEDKWLPALVDNKMITAYFVEQAIFYYRSLKRSKSPVKKAVNYLSLSKEEESTLEELLHLLSPKEIRSFESSLETLNDDYFNKITSCRKPYKSDDYIQQLQAVNFSEKKRPAVLRRLSNEEDGLAISFDNYLKTYAGSLLNDLLSDDLSRQKNAKRDLIALSRNNNYFYYQKPRFEANLLAFLLDIANDPVAHQSLLAIESFEALHKKIVKKYFFRDSTIVGANLLPTPPKALNKTKEITSPDLFVALPKTLDWHSALRLKPQNDQLTPLLAEFFTSNKTPIAAGAFALSVNGSDPIEQRLLTNFAQGHLKNQQTVQVSYELCKDKKAQLASHLQSLLSQCQSQIVALKGEIDTLFNKHPQSIEGSLRLGLIASGERPKISIDDVLSAILFRDHTLISEKQPFLGQEELSALISKTLQLLITRRTERRLNHSLRVIASSSELDSKSEQELASLLSQTLFYDASQFPEFLIFEQVSGLTLRSEQVDALENLISKFKTSEDIAESYQQMMLQFAAGGGKTSVIIPILCVIIARMGYLPVILNTNELYDLGIAQLPNTLKRNFAQNLEVIERDLNFEWHVSDLKRLQKDLERWRKDKKVLLIKSSTWYGIDTTMKLAHLTQQKALALACAEVLNFFKNKSIKLEDESQLISSPLQESIRTYGPNVPIPNIIQDFTITLYKALLNIEPKDSKLSKLIALEKLESQDLNESALREMQTELAEFIANHPLFSSLEAQPLHQYLIKKDADRPKWLISIRKSSPELADLVVYGRAFIKSFFPHLLQLQQNKDFGPSIHPGDLTTAPKHDGNDVSAHFGDPLKVLTLSTQYYFLNGIPKEQFIQLLEALIEDHARHKEVMGDYTSAQLQVNRFSLPTKKLLHELSPSDVITLANECRVLKNDKLIAHFLKQKVYPQITQPLYQVRSTPADLQAAFRQGVFFSATPGLLESYPIYLSKEDSLLSPQFAARVIAKLLEPNNQGHCLLDLNSEPSDFFNDLQDKCPELFKQMSALIDRGGLLIKHASRDVVDALGEVSQSTADKHNTLFFENQRLHLKLANGVELSVDGSNIKETLKKHNIEHHEFMFFMFLELSRTTGTDIKRAVNDRALVTIGKEQAIDNTIQAVMRERKLLEKDGQKVAWGMFKELYQSIYGKEQPFDLKLLLQWMIQNEAKQQKEKLLMRAEQGITQIIESYLWDGINRGEITDPSQILSLEHQTPFSVFTNYELPFSISEPNLELTRQIEKKCALHLISRSDLGLILNERLDTLVNETAHLVSLMHSNLDSFNQEVEKEFQSQQVEESLEETETEEELLSLYSKSESFRFARETYTEVDRLPHIFEELTLITHLQRPLVIPGVNSHKYPLFYYNPQRFCPLEQAKDSDLQTFIKPIRNFLIELSPGGELNAIALTKTGAKFYAKELQQAGLSMAYAIIGLDGTVLMTSANAKLEDFEAPFISEKRKHLSVFAALLNGQILDAYHLHHFLTHYQWEKKDLNALSEFVDKVHVSSHSNKLKLLIEHTELFLSLDLTPKGEAQPLPMTSLQLKSEASSLSPSKIEPVYFETIYLLHGRTPQEINIKPYQALPAADPEVCPQHGSYYVECFDGTTLEGAPIQLCHYDGLNYYRYPHKALHLELGDGYDTPSFPQNSDSFSVSNCHSATLYEQEGLFCEGTHSNLFIPAPPPPQILPNIDLTLNQASLGLLLFKLAENAYQWAREAFLPKEHHSGEFAEVSLLSCRSTLETIATEQADDLTLALTIEGLMNDLRRLERDLKQSACVEKAALDELIGSVRHLQDAVTPLAREDLQQELKIIEHKFFIQCGLTEDDFMQAFAFMSNEHATRDDYSNFVSAQTSNRYASNEFLALLEHWQQLQQFKLSKKPCTRADLIDFKDAQDYFLEQLQENNVQASREFLLGARALKQANFASKQGFWQTQQKKSAETNIPFTKGSTSNTIKVNFF